MKQHILRLGLLSTLIALILTQTSCKERTILGQNMNLTNDNVGITEVFLTATTNTYYDTGLKPTSFYSPGYYIFAPLGNINSDPVFGKTYSDVYFQIYPQTVGFSSDFTTSTSLIPDSGEIIVPYSGFTWADSGNFLGYNQQKVQAYQILNGLQYDSNYYAYSTLPLSAPISDPVTFNIKNLNDSVLVNGINTAPHFSIKLHHDFINTLTANASSNYNSVSTFLSYINGICIKTVQNTSTKALPYMRLDGGGDLYSRAGVLLHCHTASSANDTIFSYFFDPTECWHFSGVRRDYQGTQVLNNQSTKVYLQNSPGAGIDVVIRGIKSLPQSIINKAELQITQVPSDNGNVSDSIFFPPPRLYAQKIVNGVVSEIADRFPIDLISPLEVIDGYTHAITYAATTSPLLPALTTSTYTINMPRELQAAMASGSDTIHLHINGTSDYVGAYRLVAAGGNYTNGTDNRMRLKMRVVYSKLK